MTRDGGAGRGRRLPPPGLAAMRAEIIRSLNDTAGRRNWARNGLRVAIGNLGWEEARWTGLTRRDTAYVYRSRGSRKSLRPSPSKFSANTLRMIATPGKMLIQGACFR